MPQPRLIYSPRVNLGFKGWQQFHPFDLRKYERAMGLLSGWGCVPTGRAEGPRPVTDEDLLRVHTRGYLAHLECMEYVSQALEVPNLADMPGVLTRRYVLSPMRWAAGGTVLAARRALECGIAINLGGGFHHASRDRAEGFCIYCDIALAIDAVRRDGLAGPILYIDLDAHQGNGVERIFSGDPTVAILDLYNSEIYPGDTEAKRAIRWEAPLACGTDGELYLQTLKAYLAWALHEVRPALAIYNAGTDILAGDPLGMLDVDHDSVLARDRMVFDALTDRAIPWVMLTSGGYTEHSHRLIAQSVKYVFERWG